MLNNNYIQGSNEWLEMRKGHLGASDAPIIMGDSPWKTALTLWEEKLGLREPPQTNVAMMRGNELEPIAREAYIAHTGNIVEPKVVFHPEKKWMMASLDGISSDGSVVVEIKCPGQVDHDKAKDGIVPEKYYAQLQHQLAVIGLNLLHYFSYKDGDFALIEVPRDEDFIKSMYSKEEVFWNNMQNFSPPALSERDYVKKNDDVWLHIAQEWSLVNGQLAALKLKEKVYRDQLIQLADNHNCQGDGVKVQKVIRKGSIQYKDIPELKLVDTEKYRKPSITTWRITG